MPRVEVFIASVFSEFEELRAKLRDRINQNPKPAMHAIDLNNGLVSHHPPLTECLTRLRRSHFVILLIGETYGNSPPGKEKSYTHLEYEAAIANDSDTRVLVFGIGPSYSGKMVRPSDDPRLAAWQHQVETNHTIAHISDPSDHEGICNKIVSALSGEVPGHPIFARQHETGDDLIDDDDLSGLSDSDIAEHQEVARMENWRQEPDEQETHVLKTVQALAAPARMVAEEQFQEAQNALDIGALAIARSHLRRAVKARPLHIEACYWLARLIIASGRKDQYSEALGLLERACAWFELKDQRYRAAYCLHLQARVAIKTDDAEHALTLTQKSVELCPNYGRAHLELARMLAANGQRQKAIESLRNAFRLYYPLWRLAVSDPLFADFRRDIEVIRTEVPDRERDRLKRIFANERTIIPDCAQQVLPDTSTSKPLPWYWHEAKQSILRQKAAIDAKVEAFLRAKQDANPNGSPQSSAAARLAASRIDVATRIDSLRSNHATLEAHVTQTTINLVIGAIILIIAVFGLFQSGFVFAIAVAAAAISLGVLGVNWIGRLNASADVVESRQRIFNAQREDERLSAEMIQLEAATTAIYAELNRALPHFFSSLSEKDKHIPFRTNNFTAGALLRMSDAEISANPKVAIADRISDSKSNGQIQRLYRVTHFAEGRWMLSEWRAYS